MVARHAPSLRAFMDLEAVRDAAFCHRHREITRARGKEIARERLRAGAARQAPSGSCSSTMSPRWARTAWRCTCARDGRCTPPAKRALDRPATYSLEVVQLDPGTGTWLLDKPPLMPAQTYRTPDEWEARIAQARATFGKD